MSDEVYAQLAKVLDTLPSGFPATENGIEIKILKKIFTPEEADLFCDLRLTLETAEQIAKRTDRPIEGLGEMLTSMWEQGEIWAEESGGVRSFKMAPWIIGIWEFQINRMDREFAEMCKEYSKYFVPQYLGFSPQVMQVIPIEREIQAKHEALTYEKVSSIVENGQFRRLAADLKTEPPKALVGLHIPCVGLYLDLVALRKSLHLDLEIEVRVLWKIVQRGESGLLLRQQRTVGIVLEEGILLPAEMLKLAHGFSTPCSAWAASRIATRVRQLLCAAQRFCRRALCLPWLHGRRIVLESNWMGRFICLVTGKLMKICWLC